MDFNTDNKADNSNASFDQSEIDKLLASLSGNINPSEFEAMPNSDDSSDLFEEVGFDKDEQTLDDNLVEENIDTLADIPDTIEDNSHNQEDLFVEEIVNDNIPEDNTPADGFISDSIDVNSFSANDLISDMPIDNNLFTEQMENEANFDQIPSFSNTDMLSDEPVDTVSNMFEEEVYQSDDIAIEEAEYEESNDFAPVDTNQCNVITKGTIINGGMISDCSLNVMGKINGDIECNGKLSIFGSVVGNSKASDVYVNTKKLVGNIESAGSVKVALGTIVVGSIKSRSAVIAGAIKGDLDVSGPVILDSTAIIKGNITAKSIQMNNGAVLEGTCSFAYADINIDQIFES